MMMRNTPKSNQNQLSDTQAPKSSKRTRNTNKRRRNDLNKEFDNLIHFQFFGPNIYLDENGHWHWMVQKMTTKQLKKLYGQRGEK
jgi:hypothetical protein